ncbi:hypothetical protein KOI35_16825 [Actinoplanes bogorensis]|uniref:Uncharacterized protein n=1 Tax=Paractinoplanes bogorensis TaxID=1610840 RepID=A0ABS5YP63_9ACTN|nr:hypothetical protein [Actinoplanes bogorensis]MBU2665168.1 hypothetical protein [Actinoplanes bogorensis]
MDAVTLTSELLAIDTTNRGDPDEPGTERPVDALEFGTRVLDRLLTTSSAP